MNWLSKKLELSRGGESSSLGMEGLRGFAVLLVFFVHFFSLALPYMEKSYSYDFALWIRELGNMGVDLFFVLSGYLIYGSLINKKKTNFPSYMWRRINRIYPSFIVVLSIYIILSLLVPEQSKIPNDGALIYIVQNILLLPGVFDIKPIVTVSWSLSYELFYYLAIPAVIAVVRLRGWTPMQRFTFWLAVFVIGVLVFYNFTGPNRLLVFIGGIFIFELGQLKKLFVTRIMGFVSLSLAILFYVPILKLGFGGVAQVILLSLLFPILCMSVFGYKAEKSTFWTLTPLRWVGNMSYSYYLLHGLLLNVCFMIYGKFYGEMLGVEVWPLMILFLGATIVPSFLFFITIEKPISLRKG